MHVILTCNYSPWSKYSGGGQRSTHMLAGALSSNHKVTVIYTKPPFEQVAVPGDQPYEISWAGFFGTKSVRNAPFRPLNCFTVARMVARCLKGRETTVVHSQGEEGSAVPFLRRKQHFGFVVTPRYPSYPAPLLESSTLPLGRMISVVRDPKYTVLGIGLKRADFVCPTSRFSADQVNCAFNLDPSRTRVVFNGVDPAFFKVERQADADNGPLVFFGRLARSKGVHHLLTALESMNEPVPETIIVGRGDELSSLKRRIAGTHLETVVTLKDWMNSEELASLLSRASLAVLPSLEESFGNTMAESMAAGVPLVSTTAGSIPEVVSHDLNGLLVPPGDPAALANGILKLRNCKVLKASLSARARATALERFSWPAAARRFEQIYDNSLS